MIRVLALLLLVSPLWASAHSVEPGQMKVRVVDGFTEYPVTAVNWYDQATTYKVVAFKGNDDGREPIEVLAVPSEFLLGSLLKRQVWVKVDGLQGSKYLWICTQSVEARQAQMTMATRVCSRATLYHQRTEQ